MAWSEVEVHRIRFRRVFPWMRIGRAVGCALAPSHLLLAFVAALLIRLWQQWLLPPMLEIQSLDALAGTWLVPAIVATIQDVTLPIQQIILPWTMLTMPEVRWFTRLLASSLPLFLGTWVGIVLCRSTAIQICRDEPPTLLRNMRWGFRHGLSCIAGLGVPAGAMVVLLGITALFLLPGFILGDSWHFFSAPGVMVFAVLSAGLTLVLPVLWPLMVAGTAVDQADGFGAFSRSFSYVATFVWSALLLLVLNLIVAGVTIQVSEVVIETARKIVSGILRALHSPTSANSALIVMDWALILLRQAIVTSLFWSHATVIYLLLRQMVDGTPLDVLAGYEDDMRFHEPYPVVGIPSAAAHSPPAASTPSSET